jgi:hypothetical protein
VTQDTPAFFALDRGTVGTTASLIAPVGGRYRMLAAAAAPVELDPESVLEDLAWRVARTDASVAGSMQDWREWSRLEVRTGRPPRGVLVAASTTSGELLERAFGAAGWHIVARHIGAAPDVLGLGEACLDPTVDAVVMGGRESVEEAERDAASRLWPRVAALARFRDDLALIACGPFAERPEGIPEHRLFALPAPEPVPATTGSALRSAALEVGRHIVDGPAAGIDGRTALRASIGSLAVVLGQHVDGLEVGAAAGSRTVAGPEGETAHAVLATAAALPRELLDDDALGEAVLRWSTLAGGDPSGRLDGLRELASRPWASLGREAAHLRLAALRAAIERVESTWPGAGAAAAETRRAGIVVAGGGGFAGLPPAAAALAVVDGVRRPGAVSILHDHAGVLAPLGALPLEADRQRLLRDLLADCLLPLGSAVLTGELTEARKDHAAPSLSITSPLGDHRLRLERGQLQLVDLPPGLSARVGIDPGDGAVLGVEGRTLAMEVDGGLGGLFVDTRPIPLELPDGSEARRTELLRWEEPAWAGSER